MHAFINNLTLRQFRAQKALEEPKYIKRKNENVVRDTIIQINSKTTEKVIVF